MTEANQITSIERQAGTVHDWTTAAPADGIERAPLINGTTGAEISGETIIENSRRVASALLSRNLGAEAVVAVALPNMPVIAEIVLGVFSSGCTLAMLNPALPPMCSHKYSTR